jgi:hypothetical protein
MANKLKSVFRWAFQNLTWALVVKLLPWAVAAMTTFFFAIFAYDSGLSWYWLIFMTGVTLYVFASAVNKSIQTIVRFRDRKWSSPAPDGAALQGQPARKADETLNKRIEELEQKTVALEAASDVDAKTIEHSGREATRWQKKVQDVNATLDFRERELSELKTRYKRLHEMADTQSKNISDYVVVEDAYFCYQQLTKPMLKSVLGLDILNRSVFSITVEETTEGYIDFEGTRLKGQILLVSSRTVPPASNASITIEQRLHREEADLIASTNPKGGTFYLDRLVITIKGGEGCPQVEPQPLSITRRDIRTDRLRQADERNALRSNIESLNTRHQSEINALTSQLKEKERRIEKLSEHKLLLEVDTEFQSQVYVEYRGKEGKYLLRANIKVRFQNNDTNPVTAKKIGASLFRETEGGEKQKILNSDAVIEILEVGSTTKINLDEVRIPGKGLAGSFWLYCTLEADTKHIKPLDHTCFCRVTMDAVGQPPYSVDLDADWEGALTSKGPVMLTPRT